jgi:hypothetical protein
MVLPPVVVAEVDVVCGQHSDLKIDIACHLFPDGAMPIK